MIGGCPDNAKPRPSLSQRFVPGSFFAKAGSGPYQLGQHF